MCDTDEKLKEGTDIQTKRLQNILATFSKCKNNFINETEECKKLHEIKTKLEVELREARELEKSQRYHLLSSREMIENLQGTVSQLVHLRRDVKKLKEELISRDNIIAVMDKDKANLISGHNATVVELRNSNEKHIEELTVINDRKIQQVQHECDTQIAHFTCVIEELRSKIKDMETDHKDKMNIVVLEYEEKIQRGMAQIAQLQEHLASQSTRTDSNISAYKRRIEELEEKLKESQFKEYLAQSSYRPQYESRVEHPYSAAEVDTSVDLDPVNEKPFKRPSKIPMSYDRGPKPSKLEVNYYDKTPKNKKGQFNITKKRKLYNDKDFQDF